MDQVRLVGGPLDQKYWPEPPEDTPAFCIPGTAEDDTLTWFLYTRRDGDSRIYDFVRQQDTAHIN